MIIGVPKEIKNNENRVGLTPENVEVLTHAGHQVLVQVDAGEGTGFLPEEYAKAGATIVQTIDDVYAKSQMVIKVKEPIEPEYDLLRKDLLLFTYLHLAADRKLTEVLMEKQVTAIAYETVTDDQGHLPLLNPMSEIDRKSTRLNSSHSQQSRMPSSA